MPPKKRVETESGSDSGSSVDEKKPPPKKAKGNTGSSSRKNEDEEEVTEPTWQLDKMRFVKVREFKGNSYVDIREYYEKDGETRPGKKGISLSVKHFKKLLEVLPEVEQALKDL